ncbi:BON domain-containing protein [Pedobacter polaris]|uniref:BON domain-containing protein n=1 Tax=Pedobacter polaris TaxID=2571273 RepID=A0A4V5NZU2_9SPHI|nr:BON domain-containing protein [Pedobacter polaris]TKC10042.1 BON domain-containing protein [Pedobacter polaris]
MKIIKSLALMALITSTFFIGCKPKDADIKIAVEKSISALPNLTGTTVDVKDGIVTLTGQLKDDNAKGLAETTTKAVKGVKSVVNNLSITTPVLVAVDDLLTKAVNDAVKDYPTVVANVKDGIISLTGKIKKEALPKLMMAISALKPKKINNQLTTN